MRATPLLVSICSFSALLSTTAQAQATGSARPDTANDPIKILASRLELDRYKETIKGLTQFGDRRQGTDRNANAVTWIESKLKNYGCSNVERIVYDYQPAPVPTRPAGDSASRAAAAAARTAAAASGQAQGGGRMRGVRTRTGVNTDSLAQKDLTLRALNSQPTTPGRREEVYCTKGAARIRRRCTSSVVTWTAMVGVKPRTTTVQAPRS